MTTPPPDGTQPPAYNPPPPAQGYPAYSAAPPPPQQYGAPPQTAPGRTLGIVAFILSFFVQLIALVLGIVALVQSRKAGQPNGWAVAAIIISSILIVVGCIVLIIVLAVVIPQAADLLRFCQDAGPGVHEYNGIPIDCTDVLVR